VLVLDEGKEEDDAAIVVVTCRQKEEEGADFPVIVLINAQ